MTDITQFLSRLEAGDPTAAEQLLPVVYDELRKLAAAKMAQEKPGQTLQPTALVHEAYLRMVQSESGQQWENRKHFFASAAKAMRRILIENARSKARMKRGGGRGRVDIDRVDIVSRIGPADLLRLDEAMAGLKEEDPTAAELVNLRYFAGLSIADAAAATGVGVSTAYRHWNFARAWLHNALTDGSGSADHP